MSIKKRRGVINHHKLSGTEHQNHSHTLLGGRSPNSRCWQGWFLLAGDYEEKPVHVSLLGSDGCWAIRNVPCLLLLNSNICLHMAFPVSQIPPFS